MKRLKCLGTITCHDCGTSEDEKGGLKEYQDGENEEYGDTMILCQECAEDRDAEEEEEY